jgi:hypothetical protein
MPAVIILLPKGKADDKQVLFYSGCQKNVPVFKRFFLQPLMPQFGTLLSKAV